MRCAVLVGLLLIVAPPAQAEELGAKSPVARLGDLRIDVDARLQPGWTFADFDKRGSATDTQVVGVAVNNGGGRYRLSRWYGYDGDGVKIDEGPLGYQDYPRGEPTRFEIHLGERWDRIKRIKIAPN